MDSQRSGSDLSQDLHFLPEQARDVADQTPLLVQAGFPIELTQEVLNGDSMLSGEICVPAGTPVERKVGPRSVALDVYRPDSLSAGSLGREGSESPRTLPMLGPLTASGSQTGLSLTNASLWHGNQKPTSRKQ